MNNFYLRNQARAREKYFSRYPERIKTREQHLENCFVKHAFEIIDLVGDEVVLDLGAGNCWSSHFMAERGCTVVAFDYNLSSLQGLRAGKKLIEEGKSPFFHIVGGDWNNVPFKPGTFDVIFSFQSLHHSIDLENLLSILYILLKRKGRLISVGDPTMPFYVINTRGYANKRQAIQMQGGIYDNYYSVMKYLTAYRRAGFSVEEINTAAKPLDLLKSKRLGIISLLWTQARVPDTTPLFSKINSLLQPLFLHLKSQIITIVGIK